ncbi:MAG: prepilin-type N-terminal cleavage/methylation domain-containing protein [Gemmatimonadota bacterium]
MDRKGFTLIEMLIVSVVGAVVVISMFQMIVGQQRAFTLQAATLDARQTLRAGLELMANELREVSALGGDVLTIDDDSIQVRSMQQMGLVCAVSPSSPVIRVRTLGSWFEAGDSVFVFADNDIDAAADDVWLTGRLTTVDTTATCGTQPAQELTLDANLSLAASVDSIRIGAPVRAFQGFTYGLVSSTRGWFLARWDGVTVSRIVGPLRAPGEGLQLEYLNDLGVATGVPGDVRQVRVTVRADRSVYRNDGSMVNDSLTTLIQLRN